MQKIRFMKNVVFLFSALLLSCASDNTQEKPKQDDLIDGGSCSYSYDTLPAIISKIDKIENIGLDPVFIINPYRAGTDSAYRDTVSYYETNNAYISEAEFKEKGLTKGDTIYFIHGYITEGSCNPDDSRFILQKYGSRLTDME
jgi:hypothetical protein